MNPNKKILFYLCGRSGSGKDSILKKVLETNSNVKSVIPITNREMRTGEQNGVEYYFISTNEFKTIINENKLLDYKIYHTFDSKGNPFDSYYGYPKPTELISILTGPWDVLLDIITNNSELFHNKELKLIPIYVTLDNEWELLYRVIQREMKNKIPKMKEVARRFCADQEVYPKNNEVAEIIGYDFVVYNRNISDAIDKVNHIINSILEEEK